MQDLLTLEVAAVRDYGEFFDTRGLMCLFSDPAQLIAIDTGGDDLVRND